MSDQKLERQVEVLTQQMEQLSKRMEDMVAGGTRETLEQMISTLGEKMLAGVKETRTNLLALVQSPEFQELLVKRVMNQIGHTFSHFGHHEELPVDPPELFFEISDALDAPNAQSCSVTLNSARHPTMPNGILVWERDPETGELLDVELPPEQVVQLREAMTAFGCTVGETYWCNVTMKTVQPFNEDSVATSSPERQAAMTEALSKDVGELMPQIGGALALIQPR